MRIWNNVTLYIADMPGLGGNIWNNVAGLEHSEQAEW